MLLSMSASMSMAVLSMRRALSSAAGREKMWPWRSVSTRGSVRLYIQPFSLVGYSASLSGMPIQPIMMWRPSCWMTCGA